MPTFAEVSTQGEREFSLSCSAGFNTLRLPDGEQYPEVSYIRGIVIPDPPEGIRRIALRDCNGCLIYGPFTGDEALTLSRIDGNDGLHIPVEISPDGAGALANMSPICRYYLDVECESKCVIAGRVDGWSLPAELPQMPPNLGTLQLWSKYVVNVAEHEPIRFPRTGNYIRSLTLLADDDGVIPVNGRLHFDLTVRPEPLAEVAPGVYRYDFAEWLPTLVITDLWLHGEHKAGTVTVITNDVAMPHAR